MTLRLDDVSVTIAGTALLEEVRLTVSSGEWVSVIGPNGAGKTTLLRTVMGLHRAEGAISLGSSDLAGVSRKDQARRIAYVPQDPVRPEGMPVRDFVLLGRTPHLGVLGRESRHDHTVVAEAMNSLGIDDLSERDISTLSGGESQRAVIARALAQEPELLVMDEPTSALDLAAQLDVMETVDRLRHDHGIGILSSTHDLTLAARFVDVVYLLSGGRVVERGTPGEVLTTENIARHYGAEVQVLTDRSGGLIVAPRRSPRKQQ